MINISSTYLYFLTFWFVVRLESRPRSFWTTLSLHSSNQIFNKRYYKKQTNQQSQNQQLYTRFAYKKLIEMKNLLIPDSYYMGMFCRPTSAPTQNQTIKRKSCNKNNKYISGHPVTAYLNNQNITNLQNDKQQDNNQKQPNQKQNEQQINTNLLVGIDKNEDLENKTYDQMQIDEFQQQIKSKKLTLPMNYQSVKKNPILTHTSYLKLKQKKDNVRKFIQARSNNNKKHDLGLQVSQNKPKVNPHINFTDMKSKLNFQRNDKKKKKQNQKDKRKNSQSPNWKHSTNLREKLKKKSLSNNLTQQEHFQINHTPTNKNFENRVLCSIVSLQLQKQHSQSGKSFKLEDRSKQSKRYSMLYDHQRFEEKSRVISKSQDIQYPNETKLSFNKITPCSRKNSKAINHEKGNRKMILAHNFKALAKCKKKRAWNVCTEPDQTHKINVNGQNQPKSTNVSRDISSALQPRKSSDYFINTKASYKKYLEFLQRDTQFKCNRYEQDDTIRKRSLTHTLEMFVPINADVNINIQTQITENDQSINFQGISKNTFSVSHDPIKKSDLQGPCENQSQSVINPKQTFMSVKGVKAKLTTQKHRNRVIHIQPNQHPIRKNSEKIKFNNFKNDITDPLQIEEIIPWNEQ